jgi:cell division protein ZapA (FtsZ GTPase activity inhibitor)
MATASYKVTILGTEYQLRGDDPVRIERAAALVASQIETLRQRAPNQPSGAISILAALNLAEQLLSEREGRDADAAAAAAEVVAIAKLLEAGVGSV